MATANLSEVTINSVGPPGSADPIHQDSLNSTVIFKNVYPRLISLGTSSKPIPYLAESWEISPDRLTWIFHIRRNLKFANGAAITPEVIAKNFKRILWLTRKDRTQLHSKLLGLSNWKSLASRLPGVQWNEASVIFRFTHPPEELFESLEQALYGIIPLESFDPKSGSFLLAPSTSAASGGAYRIIEWSRDHVVLSRNDQWRFGGPDRVVVRWDPIQLDKLSGLSKKYDLIISNGMNFTEDFQREQSQFFDFLVAPPFLMNFVQLNAKKPVFRSEKVRRFVQSAFYKRLFADPRAHRVLFLSTSFLPRGVPGYKEFQLDSFPKPTIRTSKKVRLVWWPPSGLPESNEVILSALTGALRAAGLEPQIIKCRDRAEMVHRLRAGDFDAIVRLTGVLIRNPFGDMKLMFQSKMGALIPDLSGQCGKLLNRAQKIDDPNSRREIAERINAQLFKDASILTYSHSGFAFLYNGKRISIHRFNVENDPFDFTAIEAAIRQ